MIKNLLVPPIEESDEYLRLARKEELADKLLSKKLSKVEKLEIYEFLTERQPPKIKKAGRPSKDDRNESLAFEFMFSRAKGEKKLHKIKRELVEKHKLSDRDNTFYAALNKGIDLLYDNATAKLPVFEKALALTDDPESEKQRRELELRRKQLLSTTQKLIKLIDDHRNKKAPKN